MRYARHSIQGDVGKLVVATNSIEEARLKSLRSRSIKNGMTIEDIDRDKLSEIEPIFVCSAAVSSLVRALSTTKNFHEYSHTRSRNEAVRSFSVHRYGRFQNRTDGVTIDSDSGVHYAKFLFGCAATSQRLARMGGLDTTLKLCVQRLILPTAAKNRSDPHEHLILIQCLTLTYHQARTSHPLLTDA